MSSSMLACTADVAAQRTLSGYPREPLIKGLPKTIQSLCPECLKVIPADLFEENGKVMIQKTCPEHGECKDIYWGDAEMYLRNERWTYDTGYGLSNPNVTGEADCPNSCGLCGMHLNPTIMGNIDLTNRCNLSCPICFANANVTGYVYEPTLEQVARMLQLYRDERPVAGRIVQFSGGEPTLHPQFHEIIAMTRRMGFSHIQIATNGIIFNNLDFVRSCAGSTITPSGTSSASRSRTATSSRRSATSRSASPAGSPTRNGWRSALPCPI
ncbi:MAG: radical SAM protein [Candidatus Aureabacteria bacterium]|nr:radical SAM protein [Candidatus Auribacterota bacterium]